MTSLKTFFTVRNAQRYGLAVALLSAVSLVCYSLNALLGLSTPLMLFIFATTIAAWYGGLGPGIFTIISGTLITSFWFRPLAFSLTAPSFIEDAKVLMAVTIGLIISKSFSSLREARQAAMANETHYRDILDSLTSFVGVLSPDGKIIYTNDASMRMIDAKRESVIGQQVPNTDWFEGLPEEKEQMREALKRAAQGEILRFDTRHRYANGAIMDIDLSISPMRNEKGEVTYLVPSAIDITDRKRREEQLRKAELAADVANKAKTLFLANISHEIRTPLGIMLGFAELLRDPLANPSDRDHYIDSISRNGRQLTRIIDEILDVSKIEAERMELDRVDFSLQDFIADIRTFVDFQCREKGLNFDFNVYTPQSLNMVTSDPGRLRQIVLNLTANAVKFAERGSITVSIAATPEPSNPKRSTLRIDVTDSGFGITPNQIDKLFLPFSQADNSMTRKFGGTGLGLYVSRKLARALEGDVVLQPQEPGRGAHFTLTVPLRAAAVAATGATAASDFKASKQIDSDASLLKGLKILVVEDSPDNQHLITRYLTRAGAQVECANNGAEGFTRALGDTFDVTLMDLQMPIMDGYEAIQKLRAAGYSAPVIALTAHAFPAERQRCFDLGFDEHLVKPIDRRLLIETLGSYRHKAAVVDATL